MIDFTLTQPLGITQPLGGIMQEPLCSRLSRGSPDVGSRNLGQASLRYYFLCIIRAFKVRKWALLVFPSADSWPNSCQKISCTQTLSKLGLSISSARNRHLLYKRWKICNPPQLNRDDDGGDGGGRAQQASDVGGCGGGGGGRRTRTRRLPDRASEREGE